MYRGEDLLYCAFQAMPLWAKNCKEMGSEVATASAQNQSANVDLFDAYFRRAGFDRDDRISGNEAVAFFQCSGLPKQVLAQIWARADQRWTGSLVGHSFTMPLELSLWHKVRELTPEMVKAALYGLAAAKIPAPKINPAATPAP